MQSTSTRLSIAGGAALTLVALLYFWLNSIYHPQGASPGYSNLATTDQHDRDNLQDVFNSTLGVRSTVGTWADFDADCYLVREDLRYQPAVQVRQAGLDVVSCCFDRTAC